MEPNNIEQDIQFIRKMIENNRKTLVDNGIPYISSGIYVIVGLIMTYTLEYFQQAKLVPWTWLALIVVLVMANILISQKIMKKKPIKTFASKMLGVIWISIGIPLVLVFLIYVITGSQQITYYLGFCCFLLGIGYALTGFLNDLKFMMALTIVWWAAAILSLFWLSIFGSLNYIGLYFALLLFVLELIPGIIIYKKWRRVYDGKEV